MQILKLLFEHDLRLDTLARRNANKSAEEVEATLQDFMKPDPTYSRFYITATDLDEERFGINVLAEFDRLAGELDRALQPVSCRTHRSAAGNLSEILQTAEIGEAILVRPVHPGSESNTGGPEVTEKMLADINLEADSNVGHYKEQLREILLGGDRVLYKEQAHDGFDLHLFSRENIYPALFPAFKKMLSDDLRLFSINGKRVRSERHFYFETWTLDRPPHGAEEVFPGTVI